MESIGQLCPEGAGPALERGAADKDGTVRRAAAQALRRCHR
jgi:HEAT repeat protein